jgi:hypothetical protein
MPSEADIAWLRALRQRMADEAPAWQREIEERKARQERDAMFGPPPEWRAPPQEAAPVQKDAAGLATVRKTNEDALAANYEPAAANDYALFGDWRDDVLADAVGFALSQTKREVRTESMARERDLLDRIKLLADRTELLAERLNMIERRRKAPCKCKD